MFCGVTSRAVGRQAGDDVDEEDPGDSDGIDGGAVAAKRKEALGQDALAATPPAGWPGGRHTRSAGI